MIRLLFRYSVPRSDGHAPVLVRSPSVSLWNVQPPKVQGSTVSSKEHATGGEGVGWGCGSALTSSAGHHASSPIMRTSCRRYIPQSCLSVVITTSTRVVMKNSPAQWPSGSINGRCEMADRGGAEDEEEQARFERLQRHLLDGSNASSVDASITEDLLASEASFGSPAAAPNSHTSMARPKSRNPRQRAQAESEAMGDDATEDLVCRPATREGRPLGGGEPRPTTSYGRQGARARVHSLSLTHGTSPRRFGQQQRLADAQQQSSPG